MKSLYFLLLLPLNLNAEVLSSGTNGFIIQIESQADAVPAVAYQQFINVGDWWNAEHTYYGKSENLSIDAKAGGCFCEIEGNKQVLHMTISYVDPGSSSNSPEIRMIGGLGPLQMMGVHGGMSWQFVSVGDDQTKIIHRYQVTGYMEGGLDKLAPIVNQVQQLQVDKLVLQLEAN